MAGEPATFFVNPPDSGISGIYDTDRVYPLGSTLNITWITNETDYGIWLWQQNVQNSTAQVDSGPAIFESISSSTSDNWKLWRVSTLSFSLNASAVFFFNLGPHLGLEDKYATCHYFNISRAAPPTTTLRSTSALSTFIAQSRTWSSPLTTPPKPSSSSPIPTGNHTGDSSPAKVGLGVGLGIGIALVLVLVGLLTTRVFRKRPSNRDTASATSGTLLTTYVVEHRVQGLPEQALSQENRVSELDGSRPVTRRASQQSPAELKASR